MKRAKKSFGKITVKKRVNVRAKEEEKKKETNCIRCENVIVVTRGYQI